MQSFYFLSLCFFNSQTCPKWQTQLCFPGLNERQDPSDLVQVVNDRLHGDFLLPIAFRVTNVVPGARRTFSDRSPRGRGARAGLACRGRRPYTYLRASRPRSMRLTVPAAINFTRPRGTPIHARSLQLLVVVSGILLTRKRRNRHTRTNVRERGTEGREKKKEEEETTHSHVCVRSRFAHV